MDIKVLKSFRKKLLLMSKDCNEFERFILYRLYSEILYAEFRLLNYRFDSFMSAENYIFNDIKENCSNE